MKRSFWVVVLAAVAGAAQAQFTFTFDEWGNGQFKFADGTVAITQGHLMGDPTGGVTAPVMVYDLPQILGDGDVAFTESPTTGEYSDAFRFYHDAVTSHLIFYSDLDGGVDAPADSGLPANLNPQFTLQEQFIGTQGWCIYDLGLGYRYEGLSDGVLPEPASMLALGIGVVGLLRRRRPR